MTGRGDNPNLTKMPSVRGTAPQRRRVHLGLLEALQGHDGGVLLRKWGNTRCPLSSFPGWARHTSGLCDLLQRGDTFTRLGRGRLGGEEGFYRNTDRKCTIPDSNSLALPSPSSAEGHPQGAKSPLLVWLFLIQTVFLKSTEESDTYS